MPQGWREGELKLGLRGVEEKNACTLSSCTCVINVSLAPGLGRRDCSTASQLKAQHWEKQIWELLKGKERKITVEFWVLPRRPVLQLTGQSSQQSRAGVRPTQLETQQVEWGVRKNMQSQGSGLGKIRQGDLRWEGIITTQVYLCAKFSTECWDRNSKPCSSDKAKYYKKKIFSFPFSLTPHSHCP